MLALFKYKVSSLTFDNYVSFIYLIHYLVLPRSNFIILQTFGLFIAVNQALMLEGNLDDSLCSHVRIFLTIVYLDSKTELHQIEWLIRF
jgi:hypothetical protein